MAVTKKGKKILGVFLLVVSLLFASLAIALSGGWFVWLIVFIFFIGGIGNLTITDDDIIKINEKEQLKNEERRKSETKYEPINIDELLPINKQAVSSDFIINKGEECVFKCSNVLMLEQKEITTSVNYGGPKARVKLAKGLTYNIGSAGVRAKKETKMIPKGKGILNLTNRRLLFKADGKNITMILRSIVDLEPYQGALKIYRNTGNPVVFELDNAALLYQSIISVLNE